MFIYGLNFSFKMLFSEYLGEKNFFRVLCVVDEIPFEVFIPERFSCPEKFLVAKTLFQCQLKTYPFTPNFKIHVH